MDGQCCPVHRPVRLRLRDPSRAPLGWPNTRSRPDSGAERIEGHPRQEHPAFSRSSAIGPLRPPGPRSALHHQDHRQHRQRAYAGIAREFGAEAPFLRPAGIAGDLSSDLEVFQHVLDWLQREEDYQPDICVHLRPTYPVRRVSDIDAIVQILLDHPELDAVRSVAPAPCTPFKMWFRADSGLLTPVVATATRGAHSLPRQQLPTVYLQNACIDAVRSRVIRESTDDRRPRVRVRDAGARRHRHRGGLSAGPRRERQSGRRPGRAITMSGLFDHLFVFEMANNHGGSVARGLKIIEMVGQLARRYSINAGVKLQYRNLDSFIHPAFRERSDVPHVQRFLTTRLSVAEFLTLVTATRDHGLTTVCTPFDEDSVAGLEDHDIEIVKVASCSADDWPLLERIAAAKRPTICSTCGRALIEVDNLVSFMTHREVDFGLLHCVSVYPTAPEDVQLGFMSRMMRRYPSVRVGYSGHEAAANVDVVKGAVAMGAAILERHVGIPDDGDP